MELTVSDKLLLQLAHVIDYGMAFNRVNMELDRIHQKYFTRVGKDVHAIRDPISPYNEATRVRTDIAILLGEDDDTQLFNLLRHHNQETQVAYSVSLDWFVSCSHEAITRYNERHVFWMIESEYQSDLNCLLGKDNAVRLHDDINGYLNKHLVCGNADSSIRGLKEQCETIGKPYTPPPAPYLEKYNKRFEALFEAIKASFHQEPKT